MKNALSEKLRALRVESGFTQKELATKLNSTDKNIWAYENGIASPPLDTLIAYSKFFECSSDYLLGLETDWGAKEFNSIPTSYSDDEQKILEQYRSLPEQLKKLVRDQLDAFTSPNELKINTKKRT